jgi:hypothetical protein
VAVGTVVAVGLELVLQWGVDAGSLVEVVGAVGTVVGLGLQSGVVEVGRLVEVVGAVGTVVAVGLERVLQWEVDAGSLVGAVRIGELDGNHRTVGVGEPALESGRLEPVFRSRKLVAVAG